MMKVHGSIYVSMTQETDDGPSETERVSHGYDNTSELAHLGKVLQEIARDFGIDPTVDPHPPGKPCWRSVLTFENVQRAEPGEGN